MRQNSVLLCLLHGYVQTAYVPAVWEYKAAIKFILLDSSASVWHEERCKLWLLDYPFYQLFSDNMDVFMFAANLSRIMQLQTVTFCLRAEIQGSTVRISFWVLFSDPTSTSSWAIALLVMRRLITIY